MLNLNFIISYNLSGDKMFGEAEFSTGTLSRYEDGIIGIHALIWRLNSIYHFHLREKQHSRVVRDCNCRDLTRKLVRIWASSAIYSL